MIETSPQRQRWSYWLLAAIGLAAAVIVITATWWHPTPSATQTATRPVASVAAHAPIAIGTGPWERVALPVPVVDVLSIAVAPDDPSMLYVCAAAAPVELWRSTDAGAHWTGARASLANSVLASQTICGISVAPDDPKRVGVQVTLVEDGGAPCANSATYLSEDRGVTWRELPSHVAAAPADAKFIWCELQVTARHLFLLDSFDTGSPAQQTTLLERSDDDGAHWTRVGGGLASGSLLSTLLIGPKDMLATLDDHIVSAQSPYETDLLVSSDGGRTWRVWSKAPESVGTVLLGARPNAGGQWPSATHPFYTLSYDQIPSNLYREGVYASADGRQWSQLPTLPVPGVSAERRGILQVLAALPDGRLAAWGADPQGGVPAQSAFGEPTTAFWLWLWDPLAHEWQVVSTPLATEASEVCALCWFSQSAVDREGATYLYVSSLNPMQGSAQPGLFRIRLPRRP